LLAAMLLALPAAAQDRPVIVADSYPMAYFAERLAGGAADVRLVVPEGRDPSSWRPTLAEIAEIQAADLIVLNGAGLADWTTRAALPRARTVETARGLTDALIPTETITHSHGAEGAHSHEGTATHTWLDFEQAAFQAEALAAAMRRAVPDADVDAGLEALVDDLMALNAMGNALVKGRPVPVITAHPRYEYLGRAYRLDVSTLDWERGAVPDDADLAELETLIARTGARVLIWEEAPPEDAQEAVQALGLEQAVVPPLSTAPEEGDFVEALRAGLASLAEALGSAS
jgi:zinc transport system substrate-binding protein